jgi:hypothetical protein
MELAGVKNPKNLEGGLLISKRDDGQFLTVEIPRNVSTFGKMRYKSYGAIKELYEKTRIASINTDSVLYVLFCWLPTVLSLLLAVMVRNDSTLVSNILIMPFFICTSLLSIFALYAIKRVAIGLLGILLRGETKEKIAR